MLKGNVRICKSPLRRSVLLLQSPDLIARKVEHLSNRTPRARADPDRPTAERAPHEGPIIGQSGLVVQCLTADSRRLEGGLGGRPREGDRPAQLGARLATCGWDKGDDSAPIRRARVLHVRDVQAAVRSRLIRHRIVRATI